MPAPARAIVSDVLAVRRPARRRRSGFTLIELVLVMLVLCIILGMAVPQLRGFLAGSAARDSATQVIALAQYARAKSAAESVVYRLSFDVQNGEYWLSADAADGTGQFTQLGNDFGQTFKLPEGMRVTLERVGTTNVTSSSSTASASDIEFRPDGTSDAVVIRLTEANTNIETLIAAPAPTESFRITTAQEMNDL
jgi:prepilin-type N-terminal cleavage/methylation domain-containing protein